MSSNRELDAMFGEFFRARIAGTDTYIGCRGESDLILSDDLVEINSFIFNVSDPINALQKFAKSQISINVSEIKRRDHAYIALMRKFLNGIEIIENKTGKVTNYDITGELLKIIRISVLSINDPIRLGGIERTLKFSNPKFITIVAEDERDAKVVRDFIRSSEHIISEEVKNVLWLRLLGNVKVYRLFHLSWDMDGSLGGIDDLFLRCKFGNFYRYRLEDYKTKFAPLYEACGFTWDSLMEAMKANTLEDYNR